MRTLFIDGDSIAWRAASVAIKNGDNPVTKAVDMVEKLRRELSAGRAVIAFSSPDRRYWRHRLDPTYKNDRPEPPQAVLDIRAGIAGRNRFVRQVQGLEADDLLGMYATNPDIEGEKVVVASDAHLLQIPGKHHRPKTYAAGQVVTVNTADAESAHLQQTLAGYCPKIGDTKAEQIVTVYNYIISPVRVWEAVVATFVKQGKSPVDALLAAQITRVCRHDSVNPDTLEPILWQPPTLADEEWKESAAETPSAPADPAPASLFAGDGPRQRWA